MVLISDRLERAYHSLQGLFIGDAYGNHHAANQNKRRAEVWQYSDDTLMALSIVSNLRQFGTINQDALAESFANRRDANRGYGQAVTELLKRLNAGTDWKVAAYELFDGVGSYGNGAAMRVAPLGACFADDLALVVEQARFSSEVTHAHPEGVSGAIAVAVAASIASYSDIRSPTEFLEEVIRHMPVSDVRHRLEIASKIPSQTSFSKVAAELGNGRPSIAQRTVPFALWAAAHNVHDYKRAIEQTASVGGDVDTNCAIVGGIVVMSTGVESIPAEWLSRCEPLPTWAFEEQT